MSTSSSNEAFDHIKRDTVDYEIADTLRQLGPLGNEMLSDLLGRSQGTISGALARLRTLGVVLDTGDQVMRSSGFNENVWDLGDDSVEWLALRIDQVKRHVQELEEAHRVAQKRREQS